MTAKKDYSPETRKFLMGLKEEEFRELVVVPLLEAMPLKQVRATHGGFEAGKDIICAVTEVFGAIEYYAFVLKVGVITSKASDSESLREIVHQVEQALDTPAILPDGTEQMISRAYVICNHSFNQQALLLSKTRLKDVHGKVRVLDLPQLLDLLSEYLPDLLEYSQNRQAQYLVRIFERHRFLRHLHLMGYSHKVLLRQCYTGGAISTSQFSGAATERCSILDILQDMPTVIVSGGMGSGKSTLLQKMILDIVSDSETGARHSVAHLPIFIDLKDMPSKALESEKDFRRHVKNHLKNDNASPGLVGQVSSLLLLLDGFDEITLASSRNSLLSFLPMLVRRPISSVPISACVMTSRPYAVPGDVKTPIVYLSPFSRDDIRSFIGRWFQRDRSSAADVQKYVFNRPDLLILGRSPLLLTMMMILCGQPDGMQQETPFTRTSLYEKLAGLFVKHWDSSRGISREHGEEEGERFVMYLARALFRRGILAADDQTVKQVTAELVEEGFLTVPVERVDIAYARYARLGVLELDSQNRLQFIHKSFAEFFCAKACVALREEESFIRNPADTQWWNVTRFVCGLLKRLDRLPKKMLKRLQDEPALLLDCACEAIFTPRKLRATMIKAALAGLAKGKKRLSAESYSTVLSLSQDIMANIDRFLPVPEIFQIDFYILLNEVLCANSTTEAASHLYQLSRLWSPDSLSDEQLRRVLSSLVRADNHEAGNSLLNFYGRRGNLRTARLLMGQIPGTRSHGWQAVRMAKADVEFVDKCTPLRESLGELPIDSYIKLARKHRPSDIGLAAIRSVSIGDPTVKELRALVSTINKTRVVTINGDIIHAINRLIKRRIKDLRTAVVQREKDHEGNKRYVLCKVIDCEFAGTVVDAKAMEGRIATYQGLSNRLHSDRR